MVKGSIKSYTNKVTVTNATMASGSCTTYATQQVTQNKLEDSLSKDRGTYNGGTTLTFTLDVNANGEDLVYTPEKERGTSTDTLEILDVMDGNLTLATHQKDYFVVTGTEVDEATGDETTVTLTPATSEKIGKYEYYVTKVDGEDGKNTYKIIVPDGIKLKITYKAVVDAAVGESPKITNTAYFNYEGLKKDAYAANYDKEVKITKAQGTSNASAKEPYFQIYKQDQWGNPIKGVTFKLYKVALNSDGTAGAETYVKEAITDKDGYVTFDDLNDLENEDAIYCFYETAVPTGYERSTKPTYFYFVAKEGLNVPGAIGIGYTDKVFEVTNNFKSASLTVPLKKTINGQNQTSSSVFGFTLKSTKTPSGASVYSDEACTSANALTDAGIAATITGSGTVNVDTLYFNTVGTYEFTLAENDLTEAQGNEGFKKDDTVYTITVDIENDSDTGLYVASATYKNADGSKSGDLLKNGIPAFNNTLTLNPVTVTLEATKKLIGDEHDKNKRMKEGEFTFEVVEDDKVIATGKNEADTDGNNISKITFDSITYTADELGTHILTVYEVAGDDPTITYSDVVFFAIVKVDTVQGSAQLNADVTYSTQYEKNLENGKPVFTNTYTYLATGSLELTGTKKFKVGSETGEDEAMSSGEFEFKVSEGQKQVATGTNDINGDIKFSKIDYDVSDIGEHTYTIEEVKGSRMFVDYSDTAYTVTVNVTDAGNGVLNANVTKVNGVSMSSTAEAEEHIVFVNIDNLVLPTGISVDVLPYILIVVISVGVGALMLMMMLVRRRRRRC
jgi:pilin isopeptide linkage protein